MATTNSGISDLFTAVTADLVDFYADAVLLPNPALISNSINIEDGSGNSVNFPLTDAWTTGASGIADGANVVAASDQSFATSVASATAVKRGAGTQVSEEALEDGQFDVVRNAVVTRLSNSVAQATDEAGFKVMLNNTETAPTNGSTLDGSGTTVVLLNQATINGGSTGALDVNVVFSPEAMGYMSKRDISLKMEEDVKHDQYIMTGTVRNGFCHLRQKFIKAVGSLTGSYVATNNVNLVNFAEAVAKLRAENAPADLNGFYYAGITPQVEFLLANELNGAGGTGTATIGSLSDIGNRALLDAVISEAVGIRWLRTNNLVTNMANTI